MTAATTCHRAFAVAALTATAFIVAAARPQPAQATHCVNAKKLQRIHKREDVFGNYDFESERVGRCNIDWPVDFIFYGNAEIDRVKLDMLQYAGYSCGARGDCGRKFHARMNDGVDMSWDEDAGIKNGLCTGNATHIRLYAAGELDVDDSHDRMFNIDWGFYILGTTHIDNKDCLPGGWSGRSERAEGNVARAVRPIWRVSADQDAPVDEDAVPLRNRTLPCRQSGPHILCSDGRATTALVAP